MWVMLIKLVATTLGPKVAQKIAEKLTQPKAPTGATKE